MASMKREGAPTARVGVVLLAAGFGTRLACDINTSSAFNYLSGTPKPLLPLGGRVILSHWIESFFALPALSEVIVVTNAVHYALYMKWAKGVPKCRVISDGTTSNETRSGAVAAMRLGVAALSLSNDLAIIVAGDTILPDLDICAKLTDFLSSRASVGAFAYPLRDPADCVRRGMFRADNKGYAMELVEKPASVAESPSNLASAPVYFVLRGVWSLFQVFLREKADAPLKQRDAPGFWLSWMIHQRACKLLKTVDRIDIGGLAHYRDALWNYGSAIGDTEALRAPNEPAVGRAYPRAGLLGNPSDGYGGKTIAVALASEGYAEVVATPAERFSVLGNAAHELANDFGSISELAKCVERHGMNYGARQLVVAAAAAFAELLKDPKVGETANGEKKRGYENRNCMLTYSTTIPVRLGLAGSSALILATFRALARFYGTSLYKLDSDIASWPTRLRSVEKDLLGIECGLMDRVAQVFQGCTFMDFSRDGPSIYERLDETKLPQLWIGYRSDHRVGEHSGKVHSTLGQRFRAGDPDVVLKMRQLGAIAERGRKVLSPGGNISELPALMRENFDLRLDLVGRNAVGEGNMHLVETANQAGFAGKMCGSGGAVICVPDPVIHLNDMEIAKAKKQFQEAGLVLNEVKVLQRYAWPSSNA